MPGAGVPTPGPRDQGPELPALVDLLPLLEGVAESPPGLFGVVKGDGGRRRMSERVTLKGELKTEKYEWASRGDRGAHSKRSDRRTMEGCARNVEDVGRSGRGEGSAVMMTAEAASSREKHRNMPHQPGHSITYNHPHYLHIITIDIYPKHTNVPRLGAAPWCRASP